VVYATYLRTHNQATSTARCVASELPKGASRAGAPLFLLTALAPCPSGQLDAADHDQGDRKGPQDCLASHWKPQVTEQQP